MFLNHVQSYPRVIRIADTRSLNNVNLNKSSKFLYKLNKLNKFLK